jgi:hypothetical protein
MTPLFTARSYLLLSISNINPWSIIHRTATGDASHALDVMATNPTTNDMRWRTAPASTVPATHPSEVTGA